MFGVKMTMVSLTNDKVKKLKFYGMAFNTNVVSPLSKTKITDKALVCQVTEVASGGDGEKQGFQIHDIILGIRSAHGTHVIKPGADSTAHAIHILNKAAKPMYITVLREIDPNAIFEDVANWGQGQLPNGEKKKRKKKKKLVDLHLR